MDDELAGQGTCEGSPRVGWEDGEICWHADGADVTWWGLAGWIGGVLAVLALVLWLVVGLVPA